MRSIQTISVASAIALCVGAILWLTPIPIQAQSDDWTSSAEAKAHWNLAYQAMRADENARAAEEFRLATQADPKFAEAYYYRGLVLVLQAFAKEKKTTPPFGAAESFQMYLALRPNGSLAADSHSMLRELGSAARSEEVTRNANSILAARPPVAPLRSSQSAPQTAPPQKPVEQKPVEGTRAQDAARKTNSTLAAKPQQAVTTQKAPATQKPVVMQKPVAAQSQVDLSREAAMKRPPAQAAVSSSRTSDAVAAAHKTAHGAGPSSFAASSRPSKPSAAPQPAAAVAAPIAASTQCVRYVIAHSGQCGTPDEVEIRAWNPCAQPAALQVCAEETSGHWNCAMSLHSRQRKTYTGVDGARQYVCHGTGRTRALSLPSGQDLPIFPPLSR